jgi:hypothetical protein
VAGEVLPHLRQLRGGVVHARVDLAGGGIALVLRHEIGQRPSLSPSAAITCIAASMPVSAPQKSRK